jgi:RND family efflux transporter MFP subunit
LICRDGMKGLLSPSYGARNLENLEKAMSTEQPLPESNETTLNEKLGTRETPLPIRRWRRKQVAVVASVAIAVILIALFVLLKSSANRGKPQGTPAAPDKAAQTPTVATAKVVSQEVDRQLKLPGELRAYQDVALYPKVQGFVEEISVDRGSVVKRGQLLIRMSAPELISRTGEADARVRAAQQQQIELEARVRSAREQRAEAVAKLASDDGTYRRLKAASATPGVVAENDVDIARETVVGDRARIRLLEENEKAAQAVVRSQLEDQKAAKSAARSERDIESYLRINAPFVGVVTERNVDPGSLAGPSGGPSSPPMLRVQQISRLRLVVPVPEADVAGMSSGARVNFTVPAYPGENFDGMVVRISHALDEKTRSMPVELDVINDSGRLAPGMFPEVLWPTSRPKPSLFVPATAIATTTERTFVIRIRNGVTEWVDVKRGVSNGNMVEVFGDLAENDVVAVRGTDELRPNSRVNARTAT